MNSQADNQEASLPGGAVPLPKAISAKLKRKAEAAMRKIKVKKRKKRRSKKSRKITHDKTKASLELFGAGIDTPDWPQVKQFLKRYKKLRLPLLLVEASSILRSFFGATSKLGLEVLRSPVRRSKRACLYLTVKSKLPEEEEGVVYDRFVEHWWASREARAKGLLTIGIASDDNNNVENIFAKTDGACLVVFKQCHATWCRFHLHSDVHSSSIAFQKHGEERCILRLAQRTNHTLEEIGELFGCTRERIRQIEMVAERKTGHKLFKKGLITSSELSKEVLNRIRSMRKRESVAIEDDRVRRKPGRPRKIVDEDREDEDGED